MYRFHASYIVLNSNEEKKYIYLKKPKHPIQAGTYINHLAGETLSLTTNNMWKISTHPSIFLPSRSGALSQGLCYSSYPSSAYHGLSPEHAQAVANPGCPANWQEHAVVCPKYRALWSEPEMAGWTLQRLQSAPCGWRLKATVKTWPFPVLFSLKDALKKDHRALEVRLKSWGHASGDA